MDMLPGPIPDDHALMARAKQGDREAFAMLVQRHQDALLNFFKRLGANHHAEDFVQETFLRIYRYKDRYRPDAKFTTFLYTLARHVWCDDLRKVMRKGVTVDESKIDEELCENTSAQHTNNRLDIQTALNQLPQKHREVVVLGFYQGLRYEEIAHILDVPLGTVKSRMFHAMSRLKEVLDG